MDEMSEGKKVSFAGRLEKGRKIREAGFKTAIHASPHKAEIDNWIMERKWSSQAVVNELDRMYPKEDHPSSRALDNYREKYLEAGTEVKSLIRDSSKENLLRLSGFIKSFHDEIGKALKNLKIARERVDLLKDTEKTTGVPMKARSEAIKIYFEALKVVTSVLQAAGVLAMPLEGIISSQEEIDITDLDRVQKEIARIERVISNSAKRGIDIKFN